MGNLNAGPIHSSVRDVTPSPSITALSVGRSFSPTTMPVTFSVAKHPAKPVKLDAADGLTGEQILHAASRNRYQGKIAEVLQFSLSGSTSGSGSNRNLAVKIPRLQPKRNGFVGTVISAYNKHHALIIRPDDVWIAILCQFNFFVNANAELLRANFVAHEGKKELEISAEGSRYSIDFGAMARQMVDLIEKNIIDPALREWVLPAFTTTTVNDTTTSAVIMMATLKEFFAYKFSMVRCGLPRVTLEGEKSDWVDILGRLEKLKEYGVETIAWYHLLHPVIIRFVAAFDAPESQENIHFWAKVAHHHGGSGMSYYSGWINAFNVFSTEGKWLGNSLNKDVISTTAPEVLTAKEFWATYSNPRSNLVLDGTPFHVVDTQNLPSGYAEVDVQLDDNGEKFDCMMTAGLIGMKVSSSGDVGLSSSGQDDIVRPASGWWMFTKKA
ncbi:hypothetical protein C8R45DRAFT_1042894 [Mycena sanguinolenta]|nr:hypothetical protein C8R45DRAFT_1042894 [Mycena sanguinolenta]